jgi:hypothetical protein
MAGKHRRSKSYGAWRLRYQLAMLLVESLIVSYGSGPDPRS